MPTFEQVVILLSCLLSSPDYSRALETARQCQSFYQCFYHNLQNPQGASKVVLAAGSPDYSTVLDASIRDRRFFNNSTPKPLFIITPTDVAHIQAAIFCAKRTGLHVKTRCSGHDYEGQSYTANDPFFIIDLFNLHSVQVDIETETAWIESGATLGEVYYAISQKSMQYGFPAGSCPTVGVGGHFSGGGFGFLFRKYGLAADNVIDAKILDVNSNILTRESMGEDLFWAIRGGGAASFCIVLAWKVKIVPVPKTVTVSSIAYTLEQGGGELLQKWQDVAYKLDKDTFFHAVLSVANPVGGKRTISVSFTAFYLGRVDRLVAMLRERFPELGVARENCTEMSWIQSVLNFGGYSIHDPPSVLRNRTTQGTGFSKMKSDYVTQPISGEGLKGLFRYLQEKKGPYMILSPYGGRMSEIPESQIPFPHRAGNLYGIQYGVGWGTADETADQMAWIRGLYDYMEPFVSKSPRAAYLGYRDLDIGRNDPGLCSSYSRAAVWGLKYFKGNFNRLVRTKAAVDRCNFFRNAQSIPVIC